MVDDTRTQEETRGWIKSIFNSNNRLSWGTLSILVSAKRLGSKRGFALNGGIYMTNDAAAHASCRIRPAGRKQCIIEDERLVQ